MNKLVYVKARFKPVGCEIEVQEPTGETRQGLFGKKEVFRRKKKWKQTGWSDKEIDGMQLAQDIDKVVDELNGQGYEVISITPITSGAYSYKILPTFGSQCDAAYGYGFSYTKGVVILARKV